MASSVTKPLPVPPAPVPAPPQPEGLGVREQQALLHRIFNTKSDDQRFVARFIIINLIGLALLAATWAQGLLFRPFQADHSGICYLMTALFAIGIGAVYFKDWQTVRWIGNGLVYLGMVGTVLGLILTVSDLNVDNAQNFESFKTIITAIYVGSGTALYANLVACVFYLWLGTLAHLLARQEV
jgi:hypothetical protein